MRLFHLFSSAIVSYFDLTRSERITEKQVSSYLNEMKNFVANYILFDNNIRKRVIVVSKVNNRAPSGIYYSESISGGLYSGLIETLNTALREIPAILSERIHCVYRPVVVIREIEENCRHDGDIIVIRQPTRSRCVLLSLTARTAL